MEIKMNSEFKLHLDLIAKELGIYNGVEKQLEDIGINTVFERPKIEQTHIDQVIIAHVYKDKTRVDNAS
jgi:hypothetical protein